jgi:hypothetical protein
MSFWLQVPEGCAWENILRSTMAQNSVKPLLLSSLASASVTANYAAVNGAGFAHPPFLIRIINGSNMAITVSYNGIDDHEFVPANSVFQLPCQENAQPSAQVALFPKNTKVYVKGTAGTGTVYVSGYYV